MRRRLAVVVVAAGGLMSSCGGDSRTYSVEETKAAFVRHGYTLVAPDPDDIPNAPDEILAPEDGTSFFVVVTTDAEADDAWPDFERLQDDDSFDVRRANVGVFADDLPSSADRERVLAALAALPDRGLPVDVAGS